VQFVRRSADDSSEHRNLGRRTPFPEPKRRFVMGRGLLLWLIGIPLPIILLLWLFGFLS
jgi:hypothetical protein